jgi:hypothetical protein
MLNCYIIIYTAIYWITGIGIGDSRNQNELLPPIEINHTERLLHTRKFKLST